MLFSDYHTHPQGEKTQRYTEAMLQLWIDSARKRGLRDIAFTDHDRFHAGVDFDVIDKVREKNPDVKIRAGIELDNDPATSAASRKWIEANWDRLDFVLGSIHYLDRDDQMFDTIPDGAAQFDGRRIDTVYAGYFRRVRELIGTGLVDCLAHFDLVKIHGHRPDGEIGPIVNETLDLVRSRKLSMEFSTAGWRKPVNENYPGDDIARLAMGKGITFTTASDAHSHVQLGDKFNRLAEKISMLGVREVCVYEKHKRERRTLL